MYMWVRVTGIRYVGHDGTWVLALGGRLEQPQSVVERHRLDVERAEDRLLVDEVAVVDVRLARRQDHTHITEVDVHGAQVRPVQR